MNEFIDATPHPLTFPAEGLSLGQLLLRLPKEEDIETVAPAFLDEELAAAANLPPLTEEALREILQRLPQLLEQGLFLPLLIVDAVSGAIHGGVNLHHFDWERGQCEIGYWLFEHGRGKGDRNSSRQVSRGLRLLARARAH